MPVRKQILPAGSQRWICLDIGGSRTRSSSCDLRSGSNGSIKCANFQRKHRWPGKTKNEDYCPTVAAVAVKKSPDGSLDMKFGWEASNILSNKPADYAMYTHLKPVLAFSHAAEDPSEVPPEDRDADCETDDEETGRGLGKNSSKQSCPSDRYSTLYSRRASMEEERQQAESLGHDLDMIAKAFVTHLFNHLTKDTTGSHVIIVCSTPVCFGDDVTDKYLLTLQSLCPANVTIRAVDEAIAAMSTVELVEALGGNDPKKYSRFTVADLGSLTMDVTTLEMHDGESRYHGSGSHRLGGDRIIDAACQVLDTVKATPLERKFVLDWLDHSKANMDELDPPAPSGNLNERFWRRLEKACKTANTALDVQRVEDLVEHCRTYNPNGLLVTTGGASASQTFQDKLKDVAQKELPFLTIDHATEHSDALSTASFDHVLHGLEITAEHPNKVTDFPAPINMFLLHGHNEAIFVWEKGKSLAHTPGWAKSSQPAWTPRHPIPFTLERLDEEGDDLFELDLTILTTATIPRGRYGGKHELQDCFKVKRKELQARGSAVFKAKVKIDSSADKADSNVYVRSYGRQIRFCVFYRPDGSSMAEFDDLPLESLLQADGVSRMLHEAWEGTLIYTEVSETVMSEMMIGDLIEDGASGNVIQDSAVADEDVVDDGATAEVVDDDAATSRDLAEDDAATSRDVAEDDAVTSRAVAGDDAAAEVVEDDAVTSRDVEGDDASSDMEKDDAVASGDVIKGDAVASGAVMEDDAVASGDVIEGDAVPSGAVIEDDAAASGDEAEDDAVVRPEMTTPPKKRRRVQRKGGPKKRKVKNW